MEQGQDLGRAAADVFVRLGLPLGDAAGELAEVFGLGWAFRMERISA
jgi:hypothetical protein